MSRNSGGDAALLIYDETTWGDVTPSPTNKYNIPFVKIGGGPNENLVDFDEITGARTPSKRMTGKISVPLTLDVGLHYDAVGHILKHGIGIPLTTDNTDGTYTHLFQLGNARGEPVGLGMLRDQSAATKRYRLYTGLRISTLDFKSDVEGGVVFTAALDGYKALAWTATDPLSSATEVTYSSDPVGYCAAVLKIDGTAVGYVGNLQFTLDNQLGTDEYPVGNECLRSDLARGKPQVRGTMEAFFMTDDTLIDKAEAGTDISIEVVYDTPTAGNEGLSIKFTTVQLAQTSEPIETSMGLSINFDLTSYGANAVEATLVNDVTSY